jgi:uncharacterized protein (TIGR03437 family)
MPAALAPLPRVVTPVTCSTYAADNGRLDVAVLYAGLAPGLAGYYQLSIRIPVGNLRENFSLGCRGEGDSGYLNAWIPVQR